MHNIYLVDYKLAGDFFNRIISSDTSRSHHIISTIRSARLPDAGNATCELLNRFSHRTDSTHHGLSRTRERALKCLTEYKCLRLFQSTESAIHRSIASRKISPEETTIFVWNGASVMGEVARRMKANSGCKAIFMEIANIPGKIFADPCGTNSQSLLFEHPDLLDQFKDTGNSFPAWRDQFVMHKRNMPTVPQAATARRLAGHHLSDALYATTIGYRMFNWKSARDKVRAKFHTLFPREKTETEHEKLPDTYAFLPLQVSTDIQLLLNSEIDNIQALHRIAKECSLPLVVKAHPAETDIRYIQRAVKNTRHPHPVHLSSANTIDLIEGASAIHTINSTTGLEAKLFKKPTNFLSDSLYSHLNENNLANYIIEYLIDLDFFAPPSTPIPETLITKLHDRATLRLTTCE